MLLSFILVCLIILSIVFFILENVFKTKYKYNFNAKIIKIRCDKFGSQKNNYQNQLYDNFTMSSSSTYDNIKCKMFLEYNTKYLGGKDKKKQFYMTVTTSEPYIVGEKILIVSDTKNKNDFKMYNKNEVGVFGTLAIILGSLAFSLFIIMTAPGNTYYRRK